VRGDVIGLSFMQTRIMEMGESMKEQGDEPSMWVKSRQFTGRIVTVTNDKVFDCPVYNYTHEFPYIWDEINLPVRFAADHAKVERALIEAARRHALNEDLVGADEMDRLKNRFGIDIGDINPAIFWRITDNWLEITVRFLAPDHGVRGIKDRMSRDILAALDKTELVIASERQEQVTGPTLTEPQAAAKP
jgi:small-conductance mechanosensitive channel